MDQSAVTQKIGHSRAQWFASNFLPQSSDSSDGFSRRWLFLEWNRPVPKEAKTIRLGEQIIAAEREAIAAWAVEGFVRLRANDDYTRPLSHEHLRAAMDKDNNPVMSFLTEHANLVLGADNIVAAGLRDVALSQLFEEYWFFASGKLLRTVNAPGFRRGLNALQGRFGFRIEPQGAIMPEMVRGIALKK